LTRTRRLYDYTPGSGWKIQGELDEVRLLDSAGAPLLIARVPRIERNFTSPLHTAASNLRGQGPWGPQFLSFVQGDVPVVRMWASGRTQAERDQLRDSLVYVIENGCPGRLTVDVDGIVNGDLALNEPIVDTIDLDALYIDYVNWFTSAGIDADLSDGSEALEIIHQLGDTIDELRRARYADYLLGWGPIDPEGFVPKRIRTGILFGDDPAVTCASILERLTGDRRLWEFARVPPTAHRHSRG
jgi:hypothetical protein